MAVIIPAGASSAKVKIKPLPATGAEPKTVSLTLIPGLAYNLGDGQIGGTVTLPVANGSNSGD